MQPLLGLGTGRDQGALGDLGEQLFRRQATVGERIEDPVDKIGAELPRAEVHRQTEGLPAPRRPAGNSRRRHTQHDVVQRRQQPALDRDVQELRGWQQ